MINKTILNYTDFRYAISLALSHMAGAASMSHLVFAIAPSWRKNEIVDILGPIEAAARFGGIGALFAVSLVTSNAALSMLDVPLIQMMKALNPVIIYTVSLLIGLDKPNRRVACSVVVVSLGVMVTMYGSSKLSYVGVAIQAVSILSDALRITAVQATLHSSKCDIDPISMLYLVSPWTSLLLWFAASVVEFPHITGISNIPLHLIGTSVGLAFALNVIGYMFIKASSALTLSLTGIAKDVALAAIACFFFGNTVTVVQILGYAIALGGMVFYNYASASLSS